jgi:hypothetical protein
MLPLARAENDILVLRPEDPAGRVIQPLPVWTLQPGKSVRMTVSAG